MSNEIKFDYVKPEELLAWIEKKKPFLLIQGGETQSRRSA